MSSTISPLVSSPSTANFSIFSSAESSLSRSTPSPGTSRNHKRARDVHEIKVPQKRRKLLGRPKNGWTPSRRRKLVRLYLMTNLEVDDISKVLRADGFRPCKRDIQNQLTDLLQTRPNQIRSKGHITQERLRLLRECKSAQQLRRTSKARHHNQKPRNRQTAGGKDFAADVPGESTGVNSETSLSSPEHADFWSWLDVCLGGDQIPGSRSLKLFDPLKTQPGSPNFDASLMCLDRPGNDEPSLERDHFVGIGDSHESSFLSEETSIALSASRLEAAMYDTTEDTLSQGLDSPTISDLPLLDLPPPIPQKSALRPTVGISKLDGRELLGLNNPSASSTSHLSDIERSSSFEFEKPRSQYHVNPMVVNTNLVTMDQGLDIRSQPLLRTRAARPSVLNFTSLRRRLSQGSHKHSSSTLEDIISLMEHFTISTSSAASSVPSKVASSTHLPILEEEVPLPNKIEYPVMLPGAFPEYCWEQINNNNLRRCNKGQKYRKASLICRHTSPYSPSRILNPKFTQYQVYENPSGERIDIFGNTALHIAATLATPPHFLIDLVKSAVNVHTLNNGGQTFLHLVHPESHGFCHAAGNGPDEPAFANDICTLLTELKKRDFYFRQQDHHGRTSLHWLTRPGIPQHDFLKISTTLRHLRIKLPTSRDNLGFTVTGQMKHFGMLDPDEEQGHDRTLRVANSSLYENGHIQNYTKNAVIETIDDLQRYEYHTDLLRTIIEGQKSPRFENWNGRNGLHCLAEVSFDLHLSNGRSSPIQPFEPKSGSAVKREIYLENLLSSGVDPNSYDKNGTTPLMAFIIHTRAGEDEASTTRILTKLFTAGADIHRRNRLGETALHIAVKLGRKPAAKFLLNVGANVHARTHDGLGILALGHRYANKAGRDESLYAQIMLCISLVVNAKAVSAPTILQEWAFVKKGYVPRDTASPIYRDNNFFEDD